MKACVHRGGSWLPTDLHRNHSETSSSTDTSSGSGRSSREKVEEVGKKRRRYLGDKGLLLVGV